LACRVNDLVGAVLADGLSERFFPTVTQSVNIQFLHFIASAAAVRRNPVILGDFLDQFGITIWASSRSLRLKIPS
jgi:hypothetical protein